MATKNPKVVKDKTTPKEKLIPVRFLVRTVIPVQQYGNIQAEIEINAESIESAKSIVMPHIEELYQKYAEQNRDGKNPTFYNKANVTVEEKNVETTSKQSTTLAPIPTFNTKKPALVEPVIEKTPGYIKAEDAVLNATSKDALDVVEEKIKKSIKLTEQEKASLYVLVITKRKQFN